MRRSTIDSCSEAQLALELAREQLLSLQSEAGWWRGELQTNVTMDAEDMLLREFLSIRRPEETERSAAWIRSQQRPDGTWANFHGGPGELSTSIEAYWALRLAGDPADAEHMRPAAEFIRQQGGLEGARVFTKLWLALFGLWSWDRLPALPPEIILLPASVPLNVYDFACWARQTIVAVSLVKAHRPVRPLGFTLRELRAGDHPDDEHQPGRGRHAAARRGSWLNGLDRLLCAYERWPIDPLRRRALARAEQWILERQEADGSWGGIQPPWVYSLIALNVTGYPVDHPVLRRGLEGLARFMIEDRDDSRGVGAPAGPSRRLEACQSPVWDTALAMVALSDAGVSGEDPAMVRAADWLLGEEIAQRGDWSVVRPDLEPGGWAFEFANVNYPDVDDTAEVLLALHHAREGQAGPLLDGVFQRALRWVEGMQSSDGPWAAFDVDNTRVLVRELPFLDFGEVIDEPSADVTGHTLEILGLLGLGRTPAARRGVQWLIDHQEPGGSWFGRWGVNHIYGTGAVIPGLIAVGISPSHESVRRAVRWLERHQNEDGGWGEDPRSYDDPRWIGRGPSTASQTAWALLALHAAGEHSQALARGVAWLVATQRPDGGWDEPQYTGTGFPSDYYINYHLYRLTFPIMALGRCLAAARERADEQAQAPEHQGVTPITQPPIGMPAAEAVMDRAGGENFPVASRLLPRRSRGDLLALYGFTRLVDELGDSAAGDRLAALDWLEADLDRAFDGDPEHPLLVRLAPTLRARALPREPFIRLIEANRVDQRVSAYQTWEELRGYCALSADPVGELVLTVLGLANERRIGLSDSICTALQLIEHCQDVAEDRRAGRVYLPQEDLDRFGCSPEALADAHAGRALREVIAFESRRARTLLEEGTPLIDELRGRPRLAIAAFVAGGRAALAAIERADYDVLAGAPQAGRGRHALALATLLIERGRRRA